MKETEILRGLGKARTKQNAKKANCFADGLVPVPGEFETFRLPKESKPAEPNAVRFGDGSKLPLLPTEVREAAEKAAAKTGNNFADGLVPSTRPAPTGLAGGVDHLMTALFGNTAPAPAPVAAAPAPAPAAPVATPSPFVKAMNSGFDQANAANDYAHGTPFVRGPGTGTSDSVPAHLSNGEAVLPAKTVQKLGPQNIARLIQQTNDGIAPKTGLAGARHFAVGDAPNTTMPDASNLSMDPKVDYDVPPGSRGVQSNIAATPDAAPAPAAAETAAPRTLTSDLTRAKNYFTGGGTPPSAPPAAAAPPSSAPGLLKKGGSFLGKAVGLGAGALGMYGSTKDMIDNGVNGNNASDLAGNTALAVGSVASTPLAVGAGSFLAGKEAGGALTEGLFGDKIAKGIAAQSQTTPNAAAVDDVLKNNPDGHLARYMRGLKGAAQPDVQPAEDAPFVQPAAAAPAAPSWQPGQMSPEETANVNEGLHNGSINTGTLQSGTGYVTRSDGTGGERVGSGLRAASGAQPAAAKPQSLLDEMRAKLSDPNATGREKDRASIALSGILNNQNALDVATMNRSATQAAALPAMMREQQAAAEASQKSADEQTANVIPKEIPGPDGKGSMPNPEYSRFTDDARYTVGQLATKALASGDPSEIAKWYDPITKQAKAFGQLDDASRADLRRMALNRSRVEQSYNRLGSRALLGNAHNASRDLTDYDLHNWHWGVGSGEKPDHAYSPDGKTAVRRDDLKSTELGNYFLPEWAKDPSNDFVSQVGKGTNGRGTSNSFSVGARPRQKTYGIDPNGVTPQPYGYLTR